jgi:hypothetical protein
MTIHTRPNTPEYDSGWDRIFGKKSKQEHCNMRAYFFTNFYMSSLQKGIQSLHCITDLMVQYDDVMRSPQEQARKDMLMDWAANHKVVILLNGGNSADLQEIYDKLASTSPQTTYPYGKFNEDEQSLNNALTCVGVVVPEKIYLLADLIRRKEPVMHTLSIIDKNGTMVVYELTDADMAVADILSQYSLAN